MADDNPNAKKPTTQIKKSSALVKHNFFFITYSLTNDKSILEGRINTGFFLGYPALLFLKKRDKINNTINTKNITFAIDAAPSAIPPNPRAAAITAIAKKPNDQRIINVIE